MNRSLFLLKAFALSLCFCSVAFGEDDINLAFFQPVPSRVDLPGNPVSPEKISLGKKLYLDKKLSGGQQISCNSCHDLKKYGVDNEPTSPGHNGQRGDRNSPTTFNAALHLAQFWDGRAATVEEQALGPILNPIEMAMPAATDLIERLKKDKEYPALFKKAFPTDKDAITFNNIGKAIGAFERTLMTPSRFDEFLAGKKDALTAEEKTGLKKFVDSGCIACHMGAGVGGGMFQKLGLVKPYPTKDEGRFKVTKNEADRGVFKVPSLRNVEKTGPYFHDGSIPDLETAVKKMAEHQLGKDLKDDEVKSIVTFLKSLTGKLPEGAQ